jgi:hypothetical protein
VVGVTDGLALGDAGEGEADADADADGEAGGLGGVGRVSRHCWLVPPWQAQVMTAAPFALDLPLTSTHLPFCAFLTAYPLPDLVTANVCSVPPVQVATSRTGESVDTPRQPVPVIGEIV